MTNFETEHYHSGYLTTWDGKQYFYRSSYELDFANLLNEYKILYEMESISIRYFDTQINKIRTAVPDFYLPETNTIVEIKSTWTFDKQNMIDKRKAYLEKGYNFKLILEHKEQDLDTSIDYENNQYKRHLEEMKKSED